jgi:hypothetical protein
MSNKYDDDDAITDDLSDAEDARDYGPAPAGQYLVRVVDIDPRKTSSKGDRMWELTLELAARVTSTTITPADERGEYRGRRVWDNLVWSRDPKARSRRRLVFLRLAGVDCSGEQTYTPGQLLGRWAIATIELGESTTGKPRNNVTFAGYATAPAQAVDTLTSRGLAPQLLRDRAPQDRAPQERGGETPF